MAKVSVLERFMAMVAIMPNGCWQWTGALYKGYGRFHGEPGVRSGLAHRVSYELHKGSIPRDVILDHTCHDPANCVSGFNCPHRRCVNPEHLEPSTNAKNCAPERSAVNQNRGKTHCIRGHEFTPENTYFHHDGKKRACRQCEAQRARDNR